MIKTTGKTKNNVWPLNMGYEKMNRSITLDREYNTVFFDFGDTLAFTNQSFPESLHKILRSLGIDIHPDELRSAIAKADYGDLREERLRMRDKSEYINFRIKYYRTVLNLIGYMKMESHAEYIQKVIGYYHKSYVKPEALVTLDILRKNGYKLGIVSNFSHALPWICDELGITEKVDFITYSDDIGSEKPEPHIFYDALMKANAKPNEVIHIGDSYGADCVGAKAVGITPILVGDHKEKGFEDCLCIENLLEILNLLHINFTEEL